MTAEKWPGAGTLRTVDATPEAVARATGIVIRRLLDAAKERVKL